MILRDHEGGEVVDVIEAVGPGEIESLKAGIVRLLRFVDGRFEQCLFVGEQDQPLWEVVPSGQPWPTMAENEVKEM
jgi:hypothetical protein